ncbi:MAG: hypothetical protein LC633_02690 [Desulfobulbaceae bacterium]|nr:hypothetical protein [Desulfobulbaceae bacterium]
MRHDILPQGGISGGGIIRVDVQQQAKSQKWGAEKAATAKSCSRLNFSHCFSSHIIHVTLAAGDCAEIIPKKQQNLLQSGNLNHPLFCTFTALTPTEEANINRING